MRGGKEAGFKLGWRNKYALSQQLLEVSSKHFGVRMLGACVVPDFFAGEEISGT